MNRYTSFFTDADGDLILPDVLPLGNYRIEEVAAPFGYVLNENYVEVKVDAQRPHATLVADYDTWKKVDRYVMRGSKGIAIFPSRALNTHLRHVLLHRSLSSLQRLRTERHCFQ